MYNVSDAKLECSYGIRHGIRINKSKTKILLNNKSTFFTSCHVF